MAGMDENKGMAVNAFMSVAGMLGINIMPAPVQRLQQNMSQQGFTNLQNFFVSMGGSGGGEGGPGFIGALAGIDEAQRRQLMTTLGSMRPEQIQRTLGHLDNLQISEKLSGLLGNDDSFRQLVEFMNRAPAEREALLSRVDSVNPQQVTRLAGIVGQNPEFLQGFSGEEGAARLNALADVLDGEHSLLNGVGGGPADPAMRQQIAGVVAGITPAMLDTARDLLTTQETSFLQVAEKGRETAESLALGNGEARIDAILDKLASGDGGGSGLTGAVGDRIIPGLSDLAGHLAANMGGGSGPMTPETRAQLRTTLLSLQGMPQEEFDKLRSVAGDLQGLGTPSDRQELLTMAMGMASGGAEGADPAAGRQQIAAQLRELAAMAPEERAAAIDAVANPDKINQLAGGIEALQGMDPAERQQLLTALEGLGLQGLEGEALTAKRVSLQNALQTLQDLEPEQRTAISGFAETYQGLPSDQDRQAFTDWVARLNQNDLGQIGEFAANPTGHALSAVFNSMNSPLGWGLGLGIIGTILTGGDLGKGAMFGIIGAIASYLFTGNALGSPEARGQQAGTPEPGSEPNPVTLERETPAAGTPAVAAPAAGR